MAGREKLSIESARKSIPNKSSILGESKRSTEEPTRSMYEKTSLALTAVTKRSLVDQARDNASQARR